MRAEELNWWQIQEGIRRIRRGLSWRRPAPRLLPLRSSWFSSLMSFLPSPLIEETATLSFESRGMRVFVSDYNFVPQVSYSFGGAHRHFDTWEDLVQDTRSLLLLNSYGIFTRLKKAGYEVPKEILRAIREYEQARQEDGFLEVGLKAIFRPLRFFPKSLHPNEVGSW